MKSHGLMRRVIAGMGANSFGVAITIGTQLASLPLFLSKWDTTTYGVWLMLSALPGYLSMADVGMVTAAGNRMTMAMGANDSKDANLVFHSAQVFMVLVCSLLALLVLPLIWWFPWFEAATTDLRLALIALCIGVLVAFFGGLSEQVFKATNRYALGTLLGNVTRLAEWCGWLVGLLLNGSFTAVAMGGLCFRLAGTVLCVALARGDSQGLTWGYRHASLSTVRALVRPAIAFMAFPMANALSFQGVTLLVGGLLGPSAVAMFNTYRTLARTVVQVTGLFSYALWPEFSRLFGQGAHQALQHLAWRSAWMSTVQAIVVSGSLFVLAPWVLRLWTHGLIPFDPVVLGILMAYAAIGGIWHVPKVLLMATNQHGALAIWSLIFGLVCVGLTALFGRSVQLPGVSSAMLVSEALIALTCSALAWRSLNDIRLHQGASA